MSILSQPCSVHVVMQNQLLFDVLVETVLRSGPLLCKKNLQSATKLLVFCLHVGLVVVKEHVISETYDEKN